MNNHDPDSDRVLFLETIKEMHKLLHFGLGWYAIERHLLEQLLRPIHAIK